MRNVANQQGWVVMLRTQRVSRSSVSVLVLFACCLIGPSVSVSKADGIDDDLAAVARTGPGGRGSVAAGTATRRLSRNGLELLPRLLQAMDTDNIVAANWYRTVFETITRRELSRDPAPEFPVSLLRSYVTNPKRQGRVRRLVLDLVERLEPGATRALIPGMLDDPEFRDDAVAAALTRGDRAKQAGQTDTAIAEFRKAFRSARSPGQVGTAADRLKGVGQEVSVVAHMGFVTHWHLLGPFDAPGTSGFELVLPPEKQVAAGVDLAATYDGKGGGKIKWVRHHSSDRLGQSNLIRAIAPVKEAVGYAYTEVLSPRSQTVQIRCGADDNLTIWLNGKQVLKRLQWLNGTRLDRFRTTVSLKRGRNRMLVKVCQGPQHKNPAVPNNWSMQLRICDAQGGGVGVTNGLPAVPEKNAANSRELNR